jgi:NAD+ kinase
MIAICPNPFRDIKCSIALEVQDRLMKAGFETCICPLFLEDGAVELPENITVRKLSDVCRSCQMVVVIGGDGTILAAARQLHNTSVPILGINLGTKGFMTTLEPDELDYVVSAAKSMGTLSCRMKLDVSVVRGNETIFSDNALNDAVIHGYGDCIKMTVMCNGSRVTEFSGDGVILATPTGSTGYSMSAGGPIVEPDAENIIITPICPHAIGARSFVLGPDREVVVKMEKLHGRRAYLSLDGNSVLDLANGDLVHVRRSESYTLMIDLGLRSFYDVTYDKLR